MDLPRTEKFAERTPLPILILKFQSRSVRVAYFGKLTALSMFEFPDTTFSLNQDDGLSACLDCQELLLDSRASPLIADERDSVVPFCFASEGIERSSLTSKAD